MKKSGVQMHFCILNNGAEPGNRPRISVDIEDVDITKEQAIEIVEEMADKCKTITGWVTYPSTKEEIEKIG